MQSGFGSATASECVVAARVECRSADTLASFMDDGEAQFALQSLQWQHLLFNRLEGSLHGELWRATLVDGLRRLGRKMLMSLGSNGIWSVRSAAVTVF